MTLDNRTDTEKIFGSFKHRDWLMTALKLHGIARVDVEFSGSGDSGSLEELICTDKNGAELKIDDITILWPEQAQYWDVNTYEYRKSEGVDKVQALKAVLEQVTYEALEVSGLDWYNNDGGQGKFYITFEEGKPKIKLDIGINVIHTEDHEFEFDDEEENDDASPSP